jgi:hypothetical protein
VSCAILHNRQAGVRTWWRGALLIALAAPALAQEDGNLPSLLFEPVVIEVIASETDAAAAPYTVRELTSLPHAGPAVNLQDWLAQREPAPALSPEQLAADIAAYDQSVLSLESADGAFAPALDEELLALGSLLQQSGDFARAQQVLERALHVNRVNDGLFNMGQVPIIERTIENLLARGDLVAADEQQEYLLYVQRRNFADRSVDLLPALTRYAEWNLFAFDARLVPTLPTTEEAATETADKQREDDSETMIDFRVGRLIAAHQVYQSLITIVTNNFGLEDSRLLNFERQLALTNYLYIATFGLEGEVDPAAMLPYANYLATFDGGFEPGRPPLGFRQGRDSLERRVKYLAEKADTTPLERAQAKLDLADWMLMFSKRMGSLELYQEAWQDMVAAGTATETLEAMFNPAWPVEVPTYLDHSYTRAALKIPDDLALEYKGYIDLEFKLSRFGIPSAVRVISKSETATPALESILARHLRRAQFRPRITDGSVRENETMQVRFYFTY